MSDDTTEADAPTLLRRAADLWDPSDRLREARERLGWSQREMGERLGTNQAGVSRWEHGDHRPGEATRERMRRLADLLEAQKK